MHPRFLRLGLLMVVALFIPAFPIARGADKPSAPKAGVDAEKGKAAAEPTIDTKDLTRIVVVCDSSGAMITKMASMKEILDKTVADLKPKQNIAIIFMQQEGIDAMPKTPTLLPATPANQRAIGVYLEGITTTGETKALPAIESAFARKPQAIVLILGEAPPDQKAALERVKALDKDKKVKVNVVAISSDGAKFDGEAVKVFAEATGGTFKVVGGDQ